MLKEKTDPSLNYHYRHLISLVMSHISAFPLNSCLAGYRLFEFQSIEFSKNTLFLFLLQSIRK